MDDLKVLYRTAGHKGNGITFIFTDNEIKDEGFLEYMNNVLASGEVSQTFKRKHCVESAAKLLIKRPSPANANPQKLYRPVSIMFRLMSVTSNQMQFPASVLNKIYIFSK